MPSGIVEAAIFVILIEDVFVARIVFGDSFAESVRKIPCLIAKFSETAWVILVSQTTQSLVQSRRNLGLQRYLSDVVK